MHTVIVAGVLAGLASIALVTAAALVCGVCGQQRQGRATRASNAPVEHNTGSTADDATPAAPVQVLVHAQQSSAPHRQAQVPVQQEVQAPAKQNPRASAGAGEVFLAHTTLGSTLMIERVAPSEQHPPSALRSSMFDGSDSSNHNSSKHRSYLADQLSQDHLVRSNLLLQSANSTSRLSLGTSDSRNHSSQPLHSNGDRTFSLEHLISNMRQSHNQPSSSSWQSRIVAQYHNASTNSQPSLAMQLPSQASQHNSQSSCLSPYMSTSLSRMPGLPPANTSTNNATTPALHSTESMQLTAINSGDSHVGFSFPLPQLPLTTQFQSLADQTPADSTPKAPQQHSSSAEAEPTVPPVRLAPVPMEVHEPLPLVEVPQSLSRRGLPRTSSMGSLISSLGVGESSSALDLPPGTAPDFTRLRQQRELAAMAGLVASVLPDVHLVSSVGSGAHGTVYKARWQGRTVAVKIISHEGTREEMDAGLMSQAVKAVGLEGSHSYLPVSILQAVNERLAQAQGLAPGPASSGANSNLDTTRQTALDAAAAVHPIGHNTLISAEQKRTMEGLVGLTVSHPNIVQAWKVVVQHVGRPDTPALVLERKQAAEQVPWGSFTTQAAERSNNHGDCSLINDAVLEAMRRASVLSAKDGDSTPATFNSATSSLASTFSCDGLLPTIGSTGIPPDATTLMLLSAATGLNARTGMFTSLGPVEPPASMPSTIKEDAREESLLLSSRSQDCSVHGTPSTATTAASDILRAASPERVTFQGFPGAGSEAVAAQQHAAHMRPTDYVAISTIVQPGPKIRQSMEVADALAAASSASQDSVAVQLQPGLTARSSESHPLTGRRTLSCDDKELTQCDDAADVAAPARGSSGQLERVSQHLPAVYPCLTLRPSPAQLASAAQPGDQGRKSRQLSNSSDTMSMYSSVLSQLADLLGAPDMPLSGRRHADPSTLGWLDHVGASVSTADPAYHNTNLTPTVSQMSNSQTGHSDARGSPTSRRGQPLGERLISSNIPRIKPGLRRNTASQSLEQPPLIPSSRRAITSLSHSSPNTPPGTSNLSDSSNSMLLDASSPNPPLPILALTNVSPSTTPLFVVDPRPEKPQVTWAASTLGTGNNPKVQYRTFIVQEFCGDGNLQAALQQGVFHHVCPDTGMQVIDMASLLSILVQVARGMTYLHARGLIHGDLKSANIMLQRVSPDGEPVRQVDLSLGTSLNASRSGGPSPRATTTHITQPAGSSDQGSACTNTLDQGASLCHSSSGRMHHARNHHGNHHGATSAARSIAESEGPGQVAGPQQKQAVRWVAKLADFGLARVVGTPQTAGPSQVMVSRIGTVSHAPPETLRDSAVLLASDVYSFGMLLWEVYSLGDKPFRSLTPYQMMHAVVVERARPAFPSHCPPDFADLALRCMSHSPGARPNFEHVVSKLEALQSTLPPRITISQAEMQAAGRERAIVHVSDPGASTSSTTNSTAAIAAALAAAGVLPEPTASYLELLGQNTRNTSLNSASTG